MSRDNQGVNWDRLAQDNRDALQSHGGATGGAPEQVQPVDLSSRPSITQYRGPNDHRDKK